MSGVIVGSSSAVIDLKKRDPMDPRRVDTLRITAPQAFSGPEQITLPVDQAVEIARAIVAWHEEQQKGAGPQ